MIIIKHFKAWNLIPHLFVVFLSGCRYPTELSPPPEEFTKFLWPPPRVSRGISCV